MENGKTHLSPQVAAQARPSIEINGNTPMSPAQGSWRNPIQRGRRSESIDLDDYFSGPRAVDKHSKWPFFMRVHGSVLPKILLPLAVVAAWSTLITLISQLVHRLEVSSILLTVLGFVVGLGLSFRSSTAYERYTEGRKYWAQLLFASQNLARIIWVHVREREGELGKKDLLGKISALNLVTAFAVSLKHKLRFEPGIEYDDLQPYIKYLESFAKAAQDHLEKPKKKNSFKVAGEYLGIPFAESNPRKYIKRAKMPLGNLPLETLKYLSAYTESVIVNGTCPIPIYQTHLVNSVTSLNEVLIGTERVLNTPMPIAYSIAISQITWVYVLMLPFQLSAQLKWITIPGTVFAAYIILGLAAIGREIENPFGNDVNDLPLEAFCEELMTDIDTLTATPAATPEDFMDSEENMPLFPLSFKGMDTWMSRSKDEIREALLTKSNANLTLRKSISQNKPNGVAEHKHEQKHDAHNHEAV